MESDIDRSDCMPDDDDLLARLLQSAGSREPPPRDAYEEVFSATTRAWRDKLQRKRRRRWAFSLAAAATFVAMAAVLLTRQPDPAAPPPLIASTDRVSGEVFGLAGGESDWHRVSTAGLLVVAGDRLRTGASGGIGLLMAPGLSLRIGESTEVSFESATRVRLVTGVVYLDADPRIGAGEAVEIVTASGSARHVGTQFELKYRDGGLRLRVREGRVVLRRGKSEVAVEQGVELSVSADGDVERAAVAAYAADWQWVQSLAPAPPDSDPSLTGLLEWVERESGRDVHFATPSLRAKAARTILHGSRERLQPMEALAVMLETTDFQYTVASDSEILIEERRY